MSPFSLSSIYPLLIIASSSLSFWCRSSLAWFKCRRRESTCSSFSLSVANKDVFSFNSARASWVFRSAFRPYLCTSSSRHLFLNLSLSFSVCRTLLVVRSSSISFACLIRRSFFSILARSRSLRISISSWLYSDILLFASSTSRRSLRTCSWSRLSSSLRCNEWFSWTISSSSDLCLSLKSWTNLSFSYRVPSRAALTISSYLLDSNSESEVLSNSWVLLSNSNLNLASRSFCMRILKMSASTGSTIFAAIVSSSPCLRSTALAIYVSLDSNYSSSCFRYVISSTRRF